MFRNVSRLRSLDSSDAAKIVILQVCVHNSAIQVTISLEIDMMIADIPVRPVTLTSILGGAPNCLWRL